MFEAMAAEGPGADGSSAATVEGDALALPFDDGEFDRIIAAEILEHIPDDRTAMEELFRVLKPGGVLAVTVPRWFAEKVNWALSDAYHHEVEGGHVRIYKESELRGRLEDVGFVVDGAPSRMPCIRPTGGSSAPWEWTTTPIPRHGIPPSSGVGHHESTRADPRRRPAAQPRRGKVGRRLRHKPA